MNYSSPKQIGDYNKYQMLSIFREKRKVSRVELSRLLGISATAVTRNITTLLDIGMIRECGAEHSIMGRKPVLLELCTDFCYVIGVDVVGGTIKVALADLMGDILRFSETPLDRAPGCQSVFRQLMDALKEMLSRSEMEKDRIKTITIGIPGIFDQEQGKSRFSLFEDGWADINLQRAVSDELGIEVIIDNDVNLDVIGESWKGVGKNFENILYVKLGQGLSSRIVLDNRLLRGERNMAGEIAYMRPGQSSSGAYNYEEMLCNDSASRQYKELTGETTGYSYTITDLILKRGKKDRAAATVIDNLLEEFSIVILNCVTVLDPQVIILGGDACNFEAEDIGYIKGKIQEFFSLDELNSQSGLKKRACVYGAVKTGLDYVDKRVMEGW